MKYYILLLILPLVVSCAKIEKALDNAVNLGDKLDKTNVEISKTNAAVHKQTLLVAIKELEDAGNLEKLFPAPTALMPAAKAFAEEATVNEIVELSYSWLKEIEEVMPMKNIDVSTGLEQDYTPEKLNRIRIEKTGKLYGLFAIAGFMQDEKVDQVITQYVYTFDRFQAAGLKVLMMRVMFLRDVMLDSSLLSEGLNNSGAMMKAIEYMDKVDKISKLPFAEQIALKVIDKVNTPAMIELSERLDSAGVKKTSAMWTRILNASEATAQSLTLLSWKGDASQDQATFDNEKAAQLRAIELVKARQAAWSAQLQ